MSSVSGSKDKKSDPPKPKEEKKAEPKKAPDAKVKVETPAGLQSKDSFQSGGASTKVNLGAATPGSGLGAPQAQGPSVTQEQIDAQKQNLPEPPLSKTPKDAEGNYITPTDDVAAQNKQLQTALHDLGYVGAGHMTGTYGSITEGAIKAFQYEHDLPVTGKFDPETRDALAKAMAEKAAGITPPSAPTSTEYTDITDEQLAAIMPNSTPELREKWLGPLNDAMEAFGINTPERQAAFLSQVAVETGDLQSMTELSPNPDHGDYYGRGMLQLTGEGNYKAAGAAMDPPVDFVADPDLVATEDYAAMTAAWYFSDKGLNELADQGRIGRVTLLINGGYTGIDNRLGAYDRALEALRPTEKTATVA